MLLEMLFGANSKQNLVLNTKVILNNTAINNINIIL